MLSKKSFSLRRKRGTNGKEKEKEEEEIVGKLFGALPIDQLVIPHQSNGEGFFVIKL